MINGGLYVGDVGDVITVDNTVVGRIEGYVTIGSGVVVVVAVPGLGVIRRGVSLRGVEGLVCLGVGVRL